MIDLLAFPICDYGSRVNGICGVRGLRIWIEAIGAKTAEFPSRFGLNRM